MEVDGTTPKGYVHTIFAKKNKLHCAIYRNFHHLISQTKPQALGPQSQAALPHELQGLAPATHHWAKMIAAGDFFNAPRWLPMLHVSETALLHSKRSEKVAKKSGAFFQPSSPSVESLCAHMLYFLFTTPPKYGMNIHLFSSEMNVFSGNFFRIWEPTRRMFGGFHLLQALSCYLKQGGSPFSGQIPRSQLHHDFTDL